MYKLIFSLALLLSCAKVPAQEVEVVDFETFQAQLEAESDTLVVYNFWATWCRPCVKEIPYFERLNQEYASKKVKVVFVSLDFPDQLHTLVIPFVKKKGMKSKVQLLNAPKQNKWMHKVSRKWSGSIPASLINMPSRKIYDFKERTFTYEELSAWVDAKLSNQ